MIVESKSSECLICLEECKNTIIFECCGEYAVHSRCYKKWKETNKTCLICRNPVLERTYFILYYITLSQIKIILSCYCFFMFTSFIYIIVVCDFNKDYCDLM